MSYISAKSSLINEIFLSREFNGLRNAKIRISQNSDYSAKILDFQRKQQEALDQGGTVFTDSELMRQLAIDYQQLLQVPEIANYLNAAANMAAFVDALTSDINAAIDRNIR